MSTFLPDTVDVLRRTPAVVAALLAGVPDTWTETPDVTDGWRPRDVVGHLISAEIDDCWPRASRRPSGTAPRPTARARADRSGFEHLFAWFAGGDLEFASFTDAYLVSEGRLPPPAPSRDFTCRDA